MIYKIKKGKHRAWPFRLGLYFKRRSIKRTVIFNEDCRYKIEGEDFLDTNKLFGIGFLWNHHEDSARFGWRYDPLSDSILIVAYCYVNGERILKGITQVKIGRLHTYILNVRDGNYYFNVSRETTGWASAVVPYTHRKAWGFPLNFYFGGNQTAPNTLTAEIKKI